VTWVALLKRIEKPVPVPKGEPHPGGEKQNGYNNRDNIGTAERF
jgi:hypothetical protein